MPKLHRAKTVAWGLLRSGRCCMIVVSHWSKPAWQNMASLLAVVGQDTPHSMPQGGKSYHLIFKKPPLVRAGLPGGARAARAAGKDWRPCGQACGAEGPTRARGPQTARGPQA